MGDQPSPSQGEPTPPRRLSVRAGFTLSCGVLLAFVMIAPLGLLIGVGGFLWCLRFRQNVGSARMVTILAVLFVASYGFQVVGVVAMVDLRLNETSSEVSGVGFWVQTVLLFLGPTVARWAWMRAAELHAPGRA